MFKCFHLPAWLGVLVLAAGCVVSPGSIEEQLPKLRDKLPETSRVYIPNPLNPQGGFLYTRNAQVVVEAFRRAFVARGIDVYMPPRRSRSPQTVAEDARAQACTVVLFTSIDYWEYGEAGFSGVGGRDEAMLRVMLADPVTERILARARLHVANGIGRSPAGGCDAPADAVAPIIQTYVNSLFPPRPEEEAP